MFCECTEQNEPTKNAGTELEALWKDLALLKTLFQQKVMKTKVVCVVIEWHFKVTFPEILVEISAASTLKVYDIKFQTFKLLHIPKYMKHETIQEKRRVSKISSIS